MARAVAAVVILGGLNETGGRDFLFSSGFAEATVLGSRSSLWPCAQSLVSSTVDEALAATAAARCWDVRDGGDCSGGDAGS
jgi:hypothetical protein